MGSHSTLDTGETIKREGQTPDSETRATSTGEARWVLQGTIGQGGMGRVVEAKDLQFSRTVAVKELRADRSDDHAKERFALEALITGNLEHAGVPPVYERGQRADGSPYYVMRRVQGRTLDQALNEAKTLRERLDLVPVVLRAAQTVGFAHSQGVVHRDLKPGNVLIGTFGEVFVVDWGLAKFRGTAAKLSQEHPSVGGAVNETVQGSVVGTPAYMAPEQARGKLDAIDERTDVFALGAVLYHVLQGRPPFMGQNVQDTVLLAAQAKPPRLDRAVPIPLQRICLKAMHPDAAQRHRNADELAKDLVGFASDAFLKQATPFSLFANVATGLVTLLTLLMAIAVSFFLPSLTDVGPPGFVIVGLTLAGLGMSAFEERTQGRLELWPMSLAAALATFCIGIAGAGGAVGRRLEPLREAMSREANLADLVHEAVGFGVTNLILAGLFTAMQLLVWGLVRRRTLLVSGR